MYEQLFDFAPVGFAVLDGHGIILDMNQAFSEIVRMEKVNLYKKPFILYIPSEGHSDFFAFLKEAMSSDGKLEKRMEIVRTGGEHRNVIIITKAFIRDGSRLCYIAVIDRTDKQLAEQEIAQAREMAEDAKLAKSQFLARVNHELRTPLNGIVGLTDVLAETNLDESQENLVESLRESTDNLQEIITVILDTTDLMLNQTPVRKSPVSLADMTRNMVSIFKEVASEKGLAMTISIDEKIPENILCDADKLKSILMKVISNAIKFTEEGEIHIYLERTKIIDGQDEFHFIISDTGIGFDQKELDRLIQPFSQGDEGFTRKYGGLGLGLTLASRLVELLGGQLWIENNEMKGSAIHFSILCKEQKE
jgi:PAS domain S-box-containing protein